MTEPQYTETEQRIHALTSHLISRDGVYSPIDLLLEDRRLMQTDYQAWRAGEVHWLSEVITCSAQRANALLRIAADWAQGLGYAPHPLDYVCWQGETLGQALEFCAPDSALDPSLLGTAFHPRPKAEHPQGDLFMDSPTTVMLNQLCKHLLARDPQARAVWQRLREHDPRHPFLACAHELITHLSPGSLLSGDADQDCRRLRLLQSAAAEWLGAAASRDCMTPHWLALATQLDATRYDSQQPTSHPAFIYADLADYDACCSAIHACSDYPRYPVLMALLIEAEFNRGERVAGLRALCKMAWLHGEDSMAQWEAVQSRDAGVRVALGTLDDTDALGAGDLPALLLIAEPGLGRHLPGGGEAPPSFAATRNLCLHPGAGAKHLQLRKNLQGLQPSLLACYLARHAP